MRFRRIVKQAEEELDRHTEPPHPGDRKYAHLGDNDDASLREEQVDETAEPLHSSGPPPMTSGQWKGMILGGIAGGLLGALILLPVALVPFIESAVIRVVMVLIIGWLAGATAGAVYWGGRTPELEGETVDLNGRPSVGTTMRNPHTDERGR